MTTRTARKQRHVGAHTAKKGRPTPWATKQQRPAAVAARKAKADARAQATSKSRALRLLAAQMQREDEVES